MLQTDMIINVIGEFQPPHNWILNCLFLIGDTSICKTNIVKLVVPIVAIFGKKIFWIKKKIRGYDYHWMIHVENQHTPKTEIKRLLSLSTLSKSNLIYFSLFFSIKKKNLLRCFPRNCCKKTKLKKRKKKRKRKIEMLRF